MRDPTSRGQLVQNAGGAVLGLHEAVEAYFIRLFEDAHLCMIHTKCITVMPKDVQLTWYIREELWVEK